MQIFGIRIMRVLLILAAVFLLWTVLLPVESSAVWMFQTVDTSWNFRNMTSRSVAIDKNTNYLHIAYGSSHLYHSYFDGFQWRTEIVDNAPGVGEYASIGIDSTGEIHISYQDTINGDLKYATNVLGKWECITIDTVNVGAFSSIAVDSSNKIHISYYDNTNHTLKYVTNASGSWVSITLDNAGDVGQYSSIAVDSSIRIHISYYDNTNHTLKYATNGSGVWVPITVDNAGDVGQYSSIAVDSGNKAYISYYDNTNHTLKYATNESGDWVPITVDNTGDAGQYNSIAIDSNDKAHISYNYYDGTTSRKLKYATNASGAWASQMADNGFWVGYFSSIAVDGGNKIHIVYGDMWNRVLTHATNDSGSWDTMVVVDAGQLGTHSSIAVDKSDKVHISYFDSIGWNLMYATNAWGGWRVEAADTWGSGINSSIALDSSDAVHISHYHDNKLEYETNGSGSWVQTTVDNAGNVGEYSSIAIDSDNKAHISYYDSTNTDVKYATNTTGSWVTSTLDSTGIVGWHTSIALDSNKKTHISYYDITNRSLKYATNVSGAWILTIVDNAFGDVGEYSSIAVDSNNKVHISYYDVFNRWLKYATNASGAWVLTTLDNSGDVGQYSSIAIDSSNNLHISYYDNTNHTLKYATNGSGSWVPITLDNAGDVGQYSSIAVDSSNKIHISYFDFTTGSLKYVTNAPIDITPPVGTVVINSVGAYANSPLVTLHTTCGDLQNACSHMQFSNNGVSWSTPEAYSANKSSWDITAAAYGGTLVEGTKYVFARFMDSSGNWSDISYDTIVLDATGPATTADPTGNTFGTAETITLSCNDGAGSGCDKTYYCLGTGCSPTTQYTTPITLSKNTALRFYSVDRLGNFETPVKKETYTFTAGYTELVLELSPQTIDQGESITVWGRLHNMTSNGADPEGEQINIVITDPKGVQTTRTTTIMDSIGTYVLQDIQDTSGFAVKGAYTIQASFAGSGLLAAADSQIMSLLVGASAGYAIVVEGKVSGNQGLDSHNKTANRIYDHLKARGFVDDNIYYFNYLSQTGVDGRPIKTQIQYAIQEWALSRMNGMPAPLYIIMVDHGSPNAFHIDNETISPANLNKWLGNLENGLNAEAKLEKRVVVIGACYSGSFISELSQAGDRTNGGRVIITSAAADEVSYKGAKEDDGVRSGEFFLEEFFTQLERGYTLKEAFEYATESTEVFTRKGGGEANTNAPYYDGAVQHPQLDDNGDKQGSNSLSGKSLADGMEAGEMFLGVGADYRENSANNPAEITDVTGTKYLASNQDSTTLWATINNDNEIYAAPWVEIRTPSTVLDPVTDGSATEQEEVGTIRRPLWHNTVAGRWELRPTDYTFSERGKYEVYYYVKDKETIEISPMTRSVVYKNKAGNTAPSAFDLLSPANGSQQRTVVLFNWAPSSDPDGLTYTLLISRNANPSTANADYIMEEIPLSMAAIGPEAGLEDLTTYYWKVIAVDSFGARTSSDIRKFKTNDPNPELPGFIEGIVTDKTSGALVASPKIVTSSGVIKVKGSNYMGFGNPGDVTLTVSAAGYAQSTVNATIRSGETSRVNITLRDNVPPQTTITSGPSDPTTSRTATFYFKSSETGSTFKCKKDSGVYAVCTSPKTYSNLSKAGHTFYVKATDATGNIDTTPAIYTWNVQ